MTADYILAPNPSGLEMRTEINAIFSAILSQNSSATEPTTTVAGMFWYDTATSIFKQRNSTNDAWIDKWDTSKGMLASLASPTFTGNVNLPSTSYIAGNLIASLASPTFTGTVTIPNLMVNTSVSLPAATSIGSVSQTEISYLDGVTSAIQTQLNSKQTTLVSGTNIKTVGGVPLLGSGDIVIAQNPSAVFANSQEFTSSGTFTVPAGVTKVMVLIAHGGGGGGGGRAGDGSTTHAFGTVGGGGGGSNFEAPLFFDVIPESSHSVTVGSGGAGGAVETNGGSGGISSFGSLYAPTSYRVSNGGSASAVNSGSSGGGGAPYGFSGGASGSAGGGIGSGQGYTSSPSAIAGCIGGKGTANNGLNSSDTGSYNASPGSAGGAGGAGKVIVYW